MVRYRQRTGIHQLPVDAAGNLHRAFTDLGYDPTAGLERYALSITSTLRRQQPRDARHTRGALETQYSYDAAATA
jgi:hypothetical protein